MKLIITRHGETEWNLRRMTQGVTNTRLTLRGIQQAKRLAERLADAPIEYIYSSPLLRAANTAGYVAERLHLPVHFDARLKEYCFGLWEGKCIDTLPQAYPELYHDWITDPVHMNIPGAENFGEYSERMREFLRMLTRKHPNDTVLVVSHSQTAKLLFTNAVGLPEKFCHRFRIDNTSLTVLHRNERGTQIQVLNDITHLGVSQI